MPKPYLEPACEFFDRTSVPKEIVDIRNNDQQRNLDYFIKRIISIPELKGIIIETLESGSDDQRSEMETSVRTQDRVRQQSLILDNLDI